MEICVFCEIILKKSEAFIIYENDLVCCFLDQFPINKGHVLVVPKRHYQEFTDVDEESLTQVMLASQKMAKALEELFQPDGITIMQNNGEFKDVEHYHMHIFPRYKGDGFSWVEPSIKVENAEFQTIKSRLKDILMKGDEHHRN